MTDKALRDETYEEASIEFGPLAAMIKRARELEGLSMRGLARRSDLSAAQISRIETGEVRPSMETLAKLAFALERPLEPLLILALYRDPLQQGLGDLRRLLHGLQRAGVGDPVQSLLALDEHEERIADLQNDTRFLEGTASAALTRLDHLRAELALVNQEANRTAALAGRSDDEDRRAQAAETSSRAHSIFNGIPHAEALASEAKAPVDANRLKLDRARNELESLVFDTAEHLFLSADRDTRVREFTEPPSLTETERGEWADAAMSAMLALQTTRAAGAGDPETRELLAKWDALTDARRKRVLEFIEDQRRLSAQESATDATEGGETEMRDQDEPE